MNLNHFRLLRVVGKGAFGKVRIVERKDTGLTFALKYIRKDEGTRGDDTTAARRISVPSMFVPADAVSQSYDQRACATSSASAGCSSISTIPFSAICGIAFRTLNICTSPLLGLPRRLHRC